VTQPAPLLRDAEVVPEIEAGIAVPFLVQPAWARDMPWLVQGLTWRGPAEPFDLGLFGAQPVGQAITRWTALRRTLGFGAAVHSRQIHGRRVDSHDRIPAGLLVTDGADGLTSRTPGLLLAVSVADCIPVFMVAQAQRAVALLHAGWRGLAQGVIEAGLQAMRGSHGVTPSDLRVHLGPAICGSCYEVGPEVHEQLGLRRPASPEPVDIVAVAVARTVAAGVGRDAITVSGACPRCQSDRFFSHRAGSTGRQMAVLGIRE
jgi:YfiH family protein